MTRQTCEDCGYRVDSSEGWKDPGGYFFCSRCWGRWRDWQDPARSYASWLPPGVGDAAVSSSGAAAPQQDGDLLAAAQAPPVAAAEERPAAAPGDQDAAKRQRRRGPYGEWRQRGRVPGVGRLSLGVGGDKDEDGWRGCSCWDSDNWDWSQWDSWEGDANMADPGLDYYDAHCHLDYVLLNEKYGLEWIRKKKICYRWEEGYCCYGSSCDFAHGPEDLTFRTALEASDLRAFALRHVPADEEEDQAGEEGRQASDCYQVEPPPPRSDWPPRPPRRRSRWRHLEPPHRLRCLVTNCCEVEAIADTRTLLRAAEDLLQGVVYCTFGCHPHNYREYDDGYEARLLEAMAGCGDKAVAWGECGLDYHKNYYDLEIPQRHALMLEVFARQARLAVARGLPLVVHTREAERDTLKVLRECVPSDHPVHIHAYQDSPWMLREVLDTMPNAIVGVSAAVTFTWTGGGVAEVARLCPLSRLVLETDAPYLAGEPKAIPRIAAKVAEIKGVSLEEVLRATNANCRRFYRVP